ncbi:hypothetical protein QJQ45_000615 [Haematococcus lacustris]|nr:hypothetical protein QJQ45_000615 [Haematococcus lacustris]
MATGPPTGPYPLPRTPSAPSCANAQVQTDGLIPSPTYQQLQQQQHEEQQSEQVAGELLAVKEVVVAEGDKGQEAVQQLEQEVTLLSRLQHPNIVRYVGTRREAASLLIFLEYVPGGSIASLLSRFGPLSEPVIRLFTRQLLSGLAYLHAQRTMHRDVKGANLLVEKTGCIKLADFGMAKTIAEAVSFTKSFKGSAFWMATCPDAWATFLPRDVTPLSRVVPRAQSAVRQSSQRSQAEQPAQSGRAVSAEVQAIFKIASSSELPAVPAALSPQASEFILLCLQVMPGTAMSPALAQQLQQAQQLEQGPPSRPLPHPGPSAVPSPSPSSLGGGGWQPGPSTVLGGGKGWPAQAAAAKAGATLPAQAGLLGHTTVKHGATEEELEDALAALVLGSNLQTLAGYAADRAAARDGPSGGGAGIGVGQEEEGLKPNANEEDRESIDREIDEGIDYTTQPALFKVRGLLSLPPLKMPPGGSLPVVLLSQQLAGQRPGTASSMLSGTSRF